MLKTVHTTLLCMLYCLIFSQLYSAKYCLFADRCEVKTEPSSVGGILGKIRGKSFITLKIKLDLQARIKRIQPRWYKSDLQTLQASHRWRLEIISFGKIICATCYVVVTDQKVFTLIIAPHAGWRVFFCVRCVCSSLYQPYGEKKLNPECFEYEHEYSNVKVEF